MAYADEGKLMALQLMGFLVSFYRKLSLGADELKKGFKGSSGRGVE